MVVLRLILYLLVMIGVLVLAYYTTKWIGRGAVSRRSGGSIRVLESAPVGRDSCLLIVKVQEKVILLGVTPAGISKLDDLEGYVEPNPAEAPPDFAAVLKEQLKGGLHRGKGTKKGRKNV